VEQQRFDVMTRSLTRVPSRRDVLRGLTGGLGLGALWLPGTAAAKKKRKKKHKKTTQQPTTNCTPNCLDRTCGNDGCGGSCGACGSNDICRGGTCCAPESPATTCAGRCGTWTNNCGQPVVCPTCPGGQQCLSNGSCAMVCGPGIPCPSYCTGCSVPTSEGETHCVAGNSPNTCPTQVCSSTADCPAGKQCQMCLGSGRCFSLCS
jgi:hypothetical protein